MDSPEAAADGLTIDRPATLGKVDILIVNYNAGPWLARAVDHLQLGERSMLAVHIVDNGSSDGSLDGLPASDQIQLDRTGDNLGFAGAIQRALPSLQRELLLVLNPDCVIR
ncbi:MAG: glycosyltransferase, partial [Pseudomonadota bacterium]